MDEEEEEPKRKLEEIFFERTAYTGCVQ
jgi:hypothetical protein